MIGEIAVRLEAVGIKVGAALEVSFTTDAVGLDEEILPTLSFGPLPIIVGAGVGPVELSIPNSVGTSVTSSEGADGPFIGALVSGFSRGLGLKVGGDDSDA